MKRKVIGVLVLVVAALALGATLASAATSFTLSLSITPSAAPDGASVTFSGDYADSGVGVASATINWTRWANGTCSGLPDGSGTLTTTDGSGHYTITSINGLPGGPWSFETSAPGATSPCREFISGAAAPAATAQVNHTFLCYSRFEQDGGMVVATDDAPALIAGGMWQPYAIQGNLPEGTNVGGYHLSCNPPATLKPTGFYVDNDGVLYDSTYATTEAVTGVYQIVG